MLLQTSCPCLCVHSACMCVQRPEGNPAVFLNPSLPYSLRWDLSLNLQLTDLAVQAAQQALGILSWPPLRRAGVATCPAMPTCLRECQGSKLRPSYQSKVPLTELFSQPSLTSGNGLTMLLAQAGPELGSLLPQPSKDLEQ